MEFKESKSMLEVREWKAAAYEEVKDMSISDAVDYILKKTAPIVAELKRKSDERKNQQG